MNKKSISLLNNSDMNSFVLKKDPFSKNKYNCESTIILKFFHLVKVYILIIRKKLSTIEKALHII